MRGWSVMTDCARAVAVIRVSSDRDSARAGLEFTRERWIEGGLIAGIVPTMAAVQANAGVMVPKGAEGREVWILTVVCA